jgi:hypothetical protein
MNRIVLGSTLVFVLVAGCNKKAKETVPDSTPPPPVQSLPPKLASNAPGGTNAGGVSPGGGGGGGSSSGSLSIGGSGGAVQNIRQAARRVQAQAELDQLALTIEQLRDPIGKMPTKEQILADIKRSLPKVFNGIEEGAYILTGTMDGGGLWAYEVDADKKPGLAIIGGRAMRSTPEDLQRYFPKQ